MRNPTNRIVEIHEFRMNDQLRKEKTRSWEIEMFENTKSSKTNTLGIVDFKQMSTLKNPEIEKLLFSTNVKIKTTIFLETVIFKN